MQRLKSLLVIIFLCVLMQSIRAQKVAIKTNTLYWATTTLNAELEFATGRKTSLSFLGVYNPWNFKDDKMMHLGAVQPEFKYWFCERFEGHFIGIHVHGMQYFGGFDKYRYDGYLVGGGLSWGYDWILSNHWNFEAELGLGLNYTWFKKSDCIPCLKNQQKKDKLFFSPTRVALSFIYLF